MLRKRRSRSGNNLNGGIMEEKITFEENMKRLGDIAAELEKGNVPLEKAVELYSQGTVLAAECRKQLDQARIKITEDSAEE